MDRLTKRGFISQKDINELLELTDKNQFGINDVYYKLKHYEDLEEQGKLTIERSKEEIAEMMDKKFRNIMCE